LGTNCDSLWDIDPTVGLFMWTGLPVFSLSVMQRVHWVAKACHFIPRISTAHGKSNFWIRSEEISHVTQWDALQKTLAILHPVTYTSLPINFDRSLWLPTPEGLLRSAALSLTSPATKPSSTIPSARDFLLFAAHHYHVFWETEVNIYHGGQLAFSTKGLPPSALVDVDSEEDALYITAAHMVARPHSQSIIRSLSKSDGQVSHLDLDTIDLDISACSVDFHSYSPDENKVTASLRELAAAYFRSLWISIFGGVLFDSGRLTIQNLHLPGKWGVKKFSADEAYLQRLESMLEIIAPYANTPAFEDLVFSGGTSRHATLPFLLAGICGQMIVCYFLCVGTSAGIWTAVALSNTLYAGRLTDLHSLFSSKNSHTEEPGMKMYVPRSPTKEIMVVATFNRSPPRTRPLRPGFLLNLMGAMAAIFGTIFRDQTRTALEFGPSTPTPAWVAYTTITLALGTACLLLLTIIIQQIGERTWKDDSEIGQRWMVYTTVVGSFVVSGLAIFFMKSNATEVWPLLDIVTYLTAIPLGVLENGRMISADDNMLHLALLTRWMMGAVASAVGSNSMTG
ncbi:hypothetical protein EIP91_003907, partial [Steccherinum ochraceum]